MFTRQSAAPNTRWPPEPPPFDAAVKGRLPSIGKTRTPLVRLVVDLPYNLLYAAGGGGKSFQIISHSDLRRQGRPHVGGVTLALRQLGYRLCDER